MSSKLLLVNNASELTTLKDVNDRVVVMFSASWCGPCKMIKPRIEEMSADSEIKFVYVDLESFQDEEHKYKRFVTSMPTFFFYYKGLIINQVIGANKNKIEEAVNSLSTR